MSQRRVNIFGDLIDTADLPDMMSNIMAPSRLIGNDFSVAAPDLMQISAGSCLLPDGVLIIETEVKYLVVPNSSLATDYTIVYQLEDTTTLGGSPAILRLISGTKRQSNFTDGTVLGWIRYPGGSIPLSSSMFIQPTPLRITPNEADFIYTANCPLSSAIKPKHLFEPQLLTGSLNVGSPIVTNIKRVRLEPTQVGETTGIDLNIVEEPLEAVVPTLGQLISGTGVASGSSIIASSTSSLTLSANTTLTTSYSFTAASSANATAGATYTNNGYIFTVTSTLVGGTSLVCRGTGSPTTSGVLTKSRGTGDTTIIFSAVSGGSLMTLAPMWREYLDYPENEACSRFVNISPTSAICTLKLPFTIPKDGQPRKLVTRLFVDFNCFATFKLDLKGNLITLSPNGGLISNTGSVMTREFDIPTADLEWVGGSSAGINIEIKAQSSRGISIAYVGLTGSPTPFLLFT